MAICKDQSVTFLNTVGYNVVRLPRKGIEPLDVIGKDGKTFERLDRPQVSRQRAGCDGRQHPRTRICLHPADVDLAVDGIGDARSPFEQFQALRLASRTLENGTPMQRAQLRDAIAHPRRTPIHDGDRSRTTLRDVVLKQIAKLDGDPN